MSKGTLPRLPAWFTCEQDALAGNLYYFGLGNRAPSPYTRQREVRAIIDIADDGTLAGVELIDDMPAPPAPAEATDGEKLVASARALIAEAGLNPQSVFGQMAEWIERRCAEGRG
jgi:hypothetical protein